MSRHDIVKFEFVGGPADGDTSQVERTILHTLMEYGHGWVIVKIPNSFGNIDVYESNGPYDYPTIETVIGLSHVKTLTPREAEQSDI